MRRYLIHPIGALVAAIAGVSALPAAAAECRTAELPDGTPALFCKDKKGKWQQQKGDVVTNAGPANGVTARGKATYRGTFSASESPRKRKRKLFDFEGHLEDAINPNATRYEGALNLVITFDGPAVTADLTGTGGVQPGKMTGVVRNGICTLSTWENTQIFEGPCSQTRFSGKIKDTPRSRVSISGTFDTQSTDYVDESARDARRAELQAQCDAGSNAACVEMDQLK